MTQPSPENNNDRKPWHARLTGLFRRSAKPGDEEKFQIPQVLVDDKRVQRAALRARSKKQMKQLGGVLLASTALSAGTQFFPGLVSTPLDEHMEKRGHAPISQYVDDADVRVYHRFNPLQPFHFSGFVAKNHWHRNIDPNDLRVSDIAVTAWETPIVWAMSFWKGVKQNTPWASDATLDAYCLADDSSKENRQAFIRPPAEFSLEDFVAGVSTIRVSNIHVNVDKEELKSAFFNFIMLHEARHADQDTGISETLREADSDLFAFKALQQRGDIDPAVLDEAQRIVTFGRVFAAISQGKISHATGSALLDGETSFYAATTGNAAIETLHTILNDVTEYNAPRFPDAMPSGQRYVYTAIALLRADALPDQLVRQKAEEFVAAAVYFNALSGNRILSHDIDTTALDVLDIHRPRDGSNIRHKPRSMNAPGA